MITLSLIKLSGFHSIWVLKVDFFFEGLNLGKTVFIVTEWFRTSGKGYDSGKRGQRLYLCKISP